MWYRASEGAKLENKLHRKCRHLRAEGEWFILTKELVDYVVAIETHFQSVILYHDLKILGGAVAFNDVRMFNYAERAKKTLFKIVIPLTFLLAGAVIALLLHRV